MPWAEPQDGLTRWPHQVRGVSEVVTRAESGERKIVLTCPTGGGKSFMQCDLIRWAQTAILYTNRRLLLEQWAKKVLVPAGIDYGVRAAGVQARLDKPVQIASIQTEHSRGIVRESRELARVKLVVVDEVHLMNNPMAQRILTKHHEDGAVIVGVTATPIDLGDFYDSLVVAGTPSELRKCGALVPCMHKGANEIDMQGFKPSAKTGEYREGDLRKAIVRPVVFANVLESYREWNKDEVPTILFGPDVSGSIWFAEEFTQAGIRAAHIDGEHCWIDGEFHPSTGPEGEKLREEILKEVRTGKIKIVCNRFVLREGIDIPELGHAILATVMGSLQTYLQSCGRILRACKGKASATIQDHGGHWYRHGSVNADRTWELTQTEATIRGLREQRLREKTEPEPICCPKCRQLRLSGPSCPKCGFVTTKRSRMVIQTDGRLKEMTGDIYKPRPVASKPNTEALWKQCYYRGKNSKNKMTFRQVEALFYLDNHYYPPRDLPLMPSNDLDWFRSVADVPYERLTK